MEISKEIKEKIRGQFANLQTKQDLLDLLNFSKKMLYGKKAKPITLKALTYFANPNICKNRYKTFKIKKKTGGERIINAPNGGLKHILRALNFALQCCYEPHQAATGFVLNKSVVDNAQLHVSKNYVFNLDLKDFFHSFGRNRVKLGFMYGPFNLHKTKEQKRLAFLLACLCTHPFEIDGKMQIVLPQGAPTSPTLTNILCQNLDRRLYGLAKRFGATYSRYADDITFSSDLSIFKRKKNPILNEKGHYDDFRSELKRIIEEQDFKVNPLKTRLQKKGTKQEVTGLTVNEKVNVNRKYIKDIRMYLYFWEAYGYQKAEGIFKEHYLSKKGHVKNPQNKFENVLDGKLEYLKMVKGFDNPTYLKLKGRYDRLVSKNENVGFLDEVLYEWETNGIEEALRKYYEKSNSSGGVFSNRIRIEDLF